MAPVAPAVESRGKAKAAKRTTDRSAAAAGSGHADEAVVVRPYMRGTLDLLVALPADRPIDEAGLARLVGRRSPAWPRLLAQLLELRLADDVSLDRHPLLLVTPAGLLFRERLGQPPVLTAPSEPTLLERAGIERLALLEALAEFGPLRVDEILAACRHLPGDICAATLARSRFMSLIKKRRLVEIVPDDTVVVPALRRYRATDAVWQIVAARRRLHPDAYDLGAFAARIAAMRAGSGKAASGSAGTSLRRRRRKLPVPGQLSLL